QLNICEYIDADLNLNILYKQKISNLKSPVLLSRFKDSQKKWLAYRDSACLYESTDFNYDNNSPYIIATKQSCISKITLERNKYIKAL
ncbi:MAG: lysozyme inhibitor LprI family protein, partial [Plesiomonas sp.]